MAGFPNDPLLATTMGLHVRDRRIELGISEANIAAALGVSVNAFQVAELGQTFFSPEQVVSLAEILRVPPSWFFQGVKE